MKNNTLKALGIAIGAAMSVMLASDMEVHAAEVYDAESGKIVGKRWDADRMIRKKQKKVTRHRCRIPIDKEMIML